ncbi:MAG: ATP-binding protein [Nitrososphaeraceae archaeon]|nr:ATP-binding protein [Nitrososphaeraceae archaeon]MDW0277510.1 ATP-binding protein [Nitrososphaeraceae archaeon]MDW3667868.1 ATP-binding protein [Nitrososphaeraceae archaeon]
MLGATFSRNNVIILLIIAIIGIGLSILSYQYSSFTANEIANISSQDVRSNAKIEVYQLSRILVRSMESISNNLQSLSNSISLLDIKNDNIQRLFDSVQTSTKDLTNGYYMFDMNGEIISKTGNKSIAADYTGIRANSTELLLSPKTSNSTYYSSIINVDNQFPLLFISYPVLGTNVTQGNITVQSNMSKFEGKVFTTIDLAKLGDFLQKELSPEFASNVGLIDKNGVILYSKNRNVVGKNYLNPEFQDLIPPEIKNEYNNILATSLTGGSGLRDISFNDNMTTIAYQPITLDGEFLWSLYISTPHSLASNVGYLINQQKNFSTIVIIVVGSMAFGIAFLILSWNKRLEGAVESRTVQLKKTNESLTESNSLLASANKQLEIHDNMQKEFINVAAHELRTPIMPILGEAELIENDISDSDYARVSKEQISSIIRNAKRLDRLAADILDVTNIEGKSLKLNKVSFDIDEILSELVTEYSRQIESDFAKNKKLKILYEPIHVKIFADKYRITQVISNIINNAIKFTDQGVINIIGNVNSTELSVLISDTGKGIDREIISRLFDKFVSRSEQGTGLGLFISKNIIESHGGTITGFNQENGTGATFIFTLPLNSK